MYIGNLPTPIVVFMVLGTLGQLAVFVGLIWFWILMMLKKTEMTLPYAMIQGVLLTMAWMITLIMMYYPAEWYFCISPVLLITYAVAMTGSIFGFILSCEKSGLCRKINWIVISLWSVLLINCIAVLYLQYCLPN